MQLLESPIIELAKGAEAQQELLPMLAYLHRAPENAWRTRISALQSLTLETSEKSEMRTMRIRGV